jgi:hypothetical protein
MIRKTDRESGNLGLVVRDKDEREIVIEIHNTYYINTTFWMLHKRPAVRIVKWMLGFQLSYTMTCWPEQKEPRRTWWIREEQLNRLLRHAEET